MSPGPSSADSTARTAPTGLPVPRPLAPPIAQASPPVNGAPAPHLDGRPTQVNGAPQARLNGGPQGQMSGGPQAQVNGGPNTPLNGVTPFMGAPTGPIGAPGSAEQSNGPGERNGQCTAPQLRRFIKSRPYVPMHELRRRFGIDGDDDDVTPVRLDPGWVYVGLPRREGSLLGDLLKAGEIGYELSLDPRTPIVIGVYPMRPIPRG